MSQRKHNNSVCGVVSFMLSTDKMDEAYSLHNSLMDALLTVDAQEPWAGCQTPCTITSERLVKMYKIKGPAIKWVFHIIPSGGVHDENCIAEYADHLNALLNKLNRLGLEGVSDVSVSFREKLS